ncbi:MAG: hypothetical protein JWM76_4523 [Pseudonocardiales bacterium]|jgi:uncharacterized protein YjbJ (UPF0337 family)|nr:hypothetical protein [Pseudonocardiales bacterium]
MAEHNKADEARKGLIASVKGKAKEFAGAVIGNDSLTAEGQLEQTQAAERKKANSVEAVADAEAAQAQAQAHEARVASAQERNAVIVEAATEKNAVRAQQVAQERAVERAGEQDFAREKAAAEAQAVRDIERAKADQRTDVRDAVGDVVDAVDEHETAKHVATNAHEEADRIRARAANLTDEADLP